MTDVAFLADADPVTMNATDLADGAVPMAAPDMTFPAIGLVTGTLACEVDATHMTFSDNYSVLGSERTDMWCGGEISRWDNYPAMMVRLVQNDLLNWNSEDPGGVRGSVTCSNVPCNSRRV